MIEKNRRNNLIIHGTEECISENKQERIHHDQELVNDIAKQGEVNIEEFRIGKIIRLGKFDKKGPKDYF